MAASRRTFQPFNLRTFPPPYLAALRGAAPAGPGVEPVCSSHPTPVPMKTTVNALSDVDYSVEVHVPAEELEPRIQEALKKQRAGFNLKGFRPGKVPLNVVRKLVGPQIAVGIAEEVIGEAYREAMGESDEYDLLGQPRLSELDYDPQKGGDLHATVKFGVRPLFDLAQMEGVPVTKYVRRFTDADVEADVERRRELAATLEPAEDGAAAGEQDVVTADIQPVNRQSAPVGPAQRDARIVLADPSLRPELKGAVQGAHVGETAFVALIHHHEEGEDDEGHEHAGGNDYTECYLVTVKAIYHRALPEMDAAFVSAQTSGKTEDADELRADIRRGLDESWERRAREAMEAKMVEAFVDAHAFAVPETLVEAALDARLDELRERNAGGLPKTFDVAAFRARTRDAAERQVRWLLVKDRLIHEEHLEVADDDFDAEFARIAGDGMDADLVKQFFTRQPEQLEGLADALLNRRVFESLGRRFAIVEKTREDIERERAEREAADREAAEREAAADRAARIEAQTANASGDSEAKPRKRGLFGFGRPRDE